MAKKPQNTIDYVGTLLPDILRLVQAQQLKGDPVFNMAYGMYDLNTGPWHKLKLAWKNGRG
jgi:hypothetical protein